MSNPSNQRLSSYIATCSVLQILNLVGLKLTPAFHFHNSAYTFTIHVARRYLAIPVL